MNPGRGRMSFRTRIDIVIGTDPGYRREVSSFCLRRNGMPLRRQDSGTQGRSINLASSPTRNSRPTIRMVCKPHRVVLEVARTSHIELRLPEY